MKYYLFPFFVLVAILSFWAGVFLSEQRMTTEKGSDCLKLLNEYNDRLIELGDYNFNVK